MKKFIVFAASFSCVFIGIEILTGLLLTSFYTPDLGSSLDAANIQEQVVIGSTHYLPPLTIGLAALGIAFAAFRLLNKRLI
ncbi:hypothetical protein [Cytobacillus purgationiresistens]|uniref:Uncharacterized protein n=1 Tax=Cytobacillus purgationiresistens TaxID=863449 RepID=A0ABU0AQ55_9BACI|nr:hypothetical protein [Cytobacillus purgationiresistens]MDQ0272523.1 hypothetical protein [Cytobacillus purgationiresistens]